MSKMFERQENETQRKYLLLIDKEGSRNISRTGKIKTVVNIAIARYSDDLEIWTYLHILANLFSPDIL